MNKNEMMKIVLNQLAIDYNCTPEDFFKDDIIFTLAEKSVGRRAMPFGNPRLELITMGRSIIVNASESIMPYVRKKFFGKSKYDIMNSPLVYGVNPLYLPDIDKTFQVDNSSYVYEIIEQGSIHNLYRYKNFHNALQYNKNSERPEALAIVAKDCDKVIGIAAASADSKTMWQIGVDVCDKYKGFGIAPSMVNKLTIEILNRGIVPYYTTDCSNLNSQRVAIKCGYFPAFSYCFRTRLTNNLISKIKLNLLKK